MVSEATHFKAIMGVHRANCPVPDIAAADATRFFNLWAAPFDCELVQVYVMSANAVTGQNTNTKHLNILDDDTEIANIDLVSGTDIAAHVPLSFGLAAERFLSTDDLISLEVEDVGTGIALDGLLIVIEYRAANLTS